MNKAILIGYIVKDLELRKAGDRSVTSFTVAVNRPFTNANGENGADFINCTVWGKQADNASVYLSKGSRVAVEGRIQTSNYEDKDGKKVYKTEIVADNIQYLESKPKQDKNNFNY